MSEPEISRETAHHVLWMFAAPGAGYPPGSYAKALLELMARSDQANLARLALGFPAEAEAVRMAQNDEDGIARLRAIAEGRDAP